MFSLLPPFLSSLPRRSAKSTTSAGNRPTFLPPLLVQSERSCGPPVPRKAPGSFQRLTSKTRPIRNGKDTPEYKEWLAWMRKYNTSGNVSDAFTVYGYSAAQTTVDVLKQCGDNLTRENVMKQAARIHDLKLPMLLPGITVSTSDR